MLISLNKEFRTNGVSLRVEAGISFFSRKYLVDETIKFPFKKSSEIKKNRIRNKNLNIAGNFVKKRETFLSSLTSK